MQDTLGKGETYKLPNNIRKTTELNNWMIESPLEFETLSFWLRRFLKGGPFAVFQNAGFCRD